MTHFFKYVLVTIALIGCATAQLPTLDAPSSTVLIERASEAENVLLAKYVPFMDQPDSSDTYTADGTKINRNAEERLIREAGQDGRVIAPFALRRMRVTDVLKGEAAEYIYVSSSAEDKESVAPASDQAEDQIYLVFQDALKRTTLRRVTDENTSQVEALRAAIDG